MNETLRQRRGHNFTPPKKIAQKIPAPYEPDAVPLADKVIHRHYFTGGSDWYIAELDPPGPCRLGSPASTVTARTRSGDGLI
jgi:hypothetical protein